VDAQLGRRLDDSAGATMLELCCTIAERECASRDTRPVACAPLWFFAADRDEWVYDVAPEFLAEFKGRTGTVPEG